MKLHEYHARSPESPLTRADESIKNLSRLTSQWEEAINTSIRSAEKESLRRFEELVQTVRHLLSTESVERSASIPNHLQQLWAETDSLARKQDQA